jgi:hypothetical protein
MIIISFLINILRYRNLKLITSSFFLLLRFWNLYNFGSFYIFLWQVFSPSSWNECIFKHHFDLFLIETREQYCINLQQKASSIIYRLICKTHYNIILSKRLDVLMENILIHYPIDQQSLKQSYIFHLKNSFKKTNQLKAYTAELRVLKNEMLIYKQIYTNMKYSLNNSFFVWQMW